MPKPQDGARDLLDQVARGDARSLERFYETCVEGLYAFVFYRVGKDPAAAEDVVHETFLVALDKQADFDAERGTLRSWVCQLSRNVIRAHLLQQRRTEEVERWDRIDKALMEAYEKMEREALVDEIIERRQTQDLVHMAMGHLTEPHRRLLEDKYVADKTLAEIAAQLGVSEDAVKSMLARARRAFRETFQTLSRGFAEAES